MGEEVVINQMSKNSSLSSTHFILVHGVSHGAWCWYKVRTLLETSGYTVTSLDLKASGIDRTDANAVLSFHDYNQPLLDLLSSLPQEHKVILVGHSAGGLNVTEATHKFPEKIQAAVYIGATMLKLGFQSNQDIKDGVPELSEWGKVYDFGFGKGMDEPPTSAILKKEFQRKLLYQRSPIEDASLAEVLLRPFPLAITEAKFNEGNDSSVAADKVPRIFVKTLQDRVIKPDQQDAMLKRWPPSQVYAIDSDHSPFFSNPFLLSGLLVKVADSF